MTPFLSAEYTSPWMLLLTQRALAQTLVARGGAYVMVAKDNQSRLQTDIAAVLATPATTPGVHPLRSAHSVEQGHGRHEQRTLTLRALLPGDTTWPGAAQVCCVERRRVCLRTGELSPTCVYGVTSLSPAQAPPDRLLALLGGHWLIENQSHWIRDVTCDEDRSQVHTGALPQVLAAIRWAILGLLRCTHVHNIAAACRRFAAQPSAALALLGFLEE